MTISRVYHIPMIQPFYKMKAVYILLFLSALLTSCYKPGSISVENKVSNSQLNSIYWGDTYIGGSLLPGQTSGEVTVKKYMEKLPAKHNVSFVLKANGKEVYLETKQQYSLTEDQSIVITIDDTTAIFNPNDF